MWQSIHSLIRILWAKLKKSWQWIRSLDLAVQAILAAAMFSLLFLVLAWWLGFNDPPDSPPENYKTYFSLHNWWPYPLFFLVLAPAIWLTWRPFLRVWPNLAETGVIAGQERREIAEAVEAVQKKTENWRCWAVAGSIAIACLLNYLDLEPKIRAYFWSKTYEEQFNEGRRENGAFSKWLFEIPKEKQKIACRGANSSADVGRGLKKPCIAAPLTQLLFMFTGYLQQFFITFFVALLLFQVLLHTLIFSCFDRLKLTRDNRVRLNLICSSPLNEFGLEHWNYALNNLYWALSPPMLIVFLSRAATDPENYAAGQRILGIAVPLVLMLPIIVTIIVRQVRLPQVWSTLEPKGPVNREDYLRQQLWPLDRNWSAKLGLVLAFALAAIALGFEISQLAGLGRS